MLQCRAAARERLTVDVLVAELKASLEWSEGTVAVIRHVWKEGGPELCGLDRQPLSIGQVSGPVVLFRQVSQI